LQQNAFSCGQPQSGVQLADELERLVMLHHPSTIAAVIVEPVAGSTGVLIPPVGYLERLRTICDRYGILLIFDEVITGFGRLGTSFATEYFGVMPDLMTVAKGITNGTLPMGAVFTRKGIYDAFMNAAPENAIEFFHGHTYSGHPVACAASMATLDIYEEEGLFARAKSLASYWEEAIHSLKGLPHLIDIRNLGLVAAVEFEPIPGQPNARAMDCLQRCFDKGLLVRVAGDIIALSPPLIITKEQIDQLVDIFARVLKELP
jgi:beta-alanine--pyruvate transaminase